MSTDHVLQNTQVQEILAQARNELQWGDYSDMGGVNVFEVWTIRADSEIDRIGAHVEYSEAVASAQLMVLAMQSLGAVSPITRTVVVWIFRNSEEDSVLEVGIERRQDNLVGEKEKRIKLIDDSLNRCQEELVRWKMEKNSGD